MSNNGLTISQFNTLIHYLGEDSCPITNLFLDWNPIYTDEFQSGDSVPVGTNNYYQTPDPVDDQQEEFSPFARLVSEAKKLQVLFLRACNITDKDLDQIVMALKPDTGLPMNRNLKVLDLSYNKFSGKAVEQFVQVFEQNRTLEFLGLAKNNLTTEDVLPLRQNIHPDCQHHRENRE